MTNIQNIPRYSLYLQFTTICRTPSTPCYLFLIEENSRNQLQCPHQDVHLSKRQPAETLLAPFIASSNQSWLFFVAHFLHVVHVISSRLS